MEIILASNNKGKIKEFSRQLEGHMILVPGEINIDFEYEEKGSTFLENACGKANALFGRVRRPVIADDSGLCVSALGNAPGVFSARYGSVQGGKKPDDAGRARSGSEPNLKLDDAGRVNLLLANLKTHTDRRAFFVCCIVLMISEFKFCIVEETCAGIIAYEPRGTNGFGYDPVFFIPECGKTMAELDENEKDSISHRGKALRQIEKFIS